jgi:hypothetical protein
LKLREIAKKFLRFKVGDGTSIYLWLDWWHPDNILYDKYGYRVIYDSRSSMDAKLSSVLNGRNWEWQPARSEEIEDIQSKYWSLMRLCG